MLGFRSLFRTHDQAQLLDISTSELEGWLSSKGYDPTAIGLGHLAEIGDDVWASMQRHQDDVGSRSIRARVIENHPTGSWTSELTVHTSPNGNRGWVWLDIVKPDDHGWTATPRLARSLVKALPVRDGASLLDQQPIRVDVGDVENVITALTDPGRRGLAFVAGTEHRARFWPWRDRVADLLHDTVGLANAWVLTADATARFNFLVGRSHATTPGWVRTYLPSVVLGDPLDAERHRFLTGTSIDRQPSRAIRRVSRTPRTRADDLRAAARLSEGS